MKKFKLRLTNLGLSFKKEIAILIIVNVVLLLAGGAAFFFKRNYFIIGGAVGLMVVFSFVYLTRYSSIEAKLKQQNIDDFINLFTFFRTYINNNYNVYQSLIEISSFAESFSQDKLNILINDIDQDKSVEPFIRFARNYDLLLIEQLMISVYQMIDQGNNSNYLREFEILFSKLCDEHYSNELERKEKKLSSLTIFPLIGSGVLVLLITIGIAQVMGEMINGL